jgi:acylpyruvate hydrolase
MRLASFRTAQSPRARLGAAVERDGRTVLLDLNAASAGIPADIVQFIEGGRPLLEAAQRLVDSGRGKTYSLEEISFLPPVPRPGKVISLGVNYPAHGEEAAHLDSVKHLMSGPPVPRAFSKLPSVLVGHRQPIPYPEATRQLDYEIELAFVIGARCKKVPAAQASEVVYGYTIYNDLSMRDVQSGEMQSGLLLLGKNFDGAGAMGPWLVTADEVADPHALELTLSVNGEVRQHDNTRNMINRIPAIVQYWSQMTLEPGDILSTGTPAGVAIFRDPPERYLLRPGDRISATIGGLGTLENEVSA